MAEHPIRLVLSDVVMPRMGGIELLETMRRDGFDVGVVLVTAHSPDDRMQRLLAQGLVDWLPKPVHLARLAEVVAGKLNPESALGDPK